MRKVQCFQSFLKCKCFEIAKNTSLFELRARLRAKSVANSAFPKIDFPKNLKNTAHSCRWAGQGRQSNSSRIAPECIFAYPRPGTLMAAGCLGYLYISECLHTSASDVAHWHCPSRVYVALSPSIRIRSRHCNRLHSNRFIACMQTSAFRCRL
jgi:hypothetical protein